MSEITLSSNSKLKIALKLKNFKSIKKNKN